MCIFYVFRTIRWYVMAEISFIRESIQGDEQTTAMFRTSPEIMADVTIYDPKELLVILFNHVANFLSVGSGFRLGADSGDKYLSLPTDSQCGVLHTNAQVPIK